MKTLIPESQPIPTTLQGFFDIAWKWMHREGAALCLDYKGNCVNRNNDNTNACIIGAAFPDSFIPQKRVNLCASGLIDLLNKSSDFNCLLNLKGELMDLQRCHDKAEDVKDCIELLKDFAIDYNLAIPELS